jgi:hypothetical protein
MFKTAYDTTPCRNYVLTKIAAELARHGVVGGEQFQSPVNPYRSESTLYNLTTVTPGLADIPPFAHPYQTAVVAKAGESGQSQVYVDVRNYTRRSREGAVVVSAPLDYELSVLRGMLQLTWSSETPVDLLNLGGYQVTIYARWLAEILTRRLALPPETQMLVTVVAAWFYLCMFIDDSVEAVAESDRLRMATQIARATYVGAEDVIRMVDAMPLFRDVAGLIAWLRSDGGSARFEDLSVAVLYTAVSGSWFGSNARENVAVAIEHPPTFVAMVTLASEERGYRNTVLGKLAQQYQKADEVRSFLFNIKHLQR